MKRIKHLVIAAALALGLGPAQAQTAMDIAPQMVPGWNLGNTLEAGPCTWISNELDWETGWQGTKTSQTVIDYIRDLGFRSVRIPCSWHMHMDKTNNQINAAWMKRVKEIVDYCINDDLYVMLNDHWDGGWIEVDGFKNLTEEKISRKCDTLATIWTQIATEFADYDHHLLFAGLNEPNAADEATYEVLKRYNQTFVNAVRATGGGNRERILVAQGPCTDIDRAYEYSVLPTDPTPNALMLEVHFYSPYQFIGMSKDEYWGYMAYYWGQNNHVEGSIRNSTWGEEAYVEAQMQKMYTKYVERGVPVIIGEYGGTWRYMTEGENQDKHDASIHDWYKAVCQYAIANGCVPMLWDTNHSDRPSGTVVNRQDCNIFNQFAYDGIIDGVNEGTWPKVITTATEHIITISDVGYATFSSTHQLDLTGIEAYAVSTVGSSSVMLESLTGKKVASNTGMILYKEGGGCIRIPFSTGDTDDIPNSLIGTASGEVTNPGNAYVLAYKDSGVGFYMLESGETIPQGKAYLTIGAAVREFIGFDNNEATDISEMENGKPKTDNSVYNLNGQRVDFSLSTSHALLKKKGLYITNGKKIIIK